MNVPGPSPYTLKGFSDQGRSSESLNDDNDTNGWGGSDIPIDDNATQGWGGSDIPISDTSYDIMDSPPPINLNLEETLKKV